MCVMDVCDVSVCICCVEQIILVDTGLSIIICVIDFICNFRKSEALPSSSINDFHQQVRLCVESKCYDYL